MKLITKIILAVVWLGSVLTTTPIQAATGSFTGAYATNFNGLGTGTAMPLGFRTMVTGTGNSTYTAAIPISAAGIAAATQSGTQTLTVWTPPAAAASSGTALFNCGTPGNTTDRALGSDATSVAAVVIELSLTNSTGSNLLGVVFSYDQKCMTNGSAGTEASELPGYAFFYSISGGTTAAEWTRVNALSLGNYTQATVSNSGNVLISFPTALTNNGRMFFRWADDNNVASSPDQMIAIDNISITPSDNTPPSVALTAPAGAVTLELGTNLTLTATAADAGGSVTKVEFFYGPTKIGETNAAPWSIVWTNVSPLGSNVLTARATDNDGATTTSAGVGVTIVPDLGIGGLYLDGANDYVTFGAAPSLGVSNFTAECWFKRLGTGATTSTGSGGVTTAIPLVTKGRGESDGSNVDCNFFFGINSANNALCADFEDYGTGLNHPITSTVAVGSNVWQHAAVTYDVASGTWVLYLNGSPIATNVIATTGNTRVPRFDSIQHAALGSALTSLGAAAGFFNGTLDEVRVWNYARTDSQISGAMNLQLAAAPGLVGRWGLNEGTGTSAGNSAGIANGTLQNGPLWVEGYPFPPTSNQPPVVNIASPTNGAAFVAPATIVITAAAADAEGSVTNVEFFSGSTSLGTDDTAPFSLVLSNVAVGNYSFSAIATDDEGLSATSTVVNVTVALPNYAPSVVSVNFPTNGATEITNSPALNVTVSDPEGTNLTVVFYGRAAASQMPGPDFTLMTLPDTQFYSSSLNGGLPAMFTTQTDWIIANRTNLNLAFVTHLGDIVQNGDNGGNNVEWRVATNALYRFENPLTTLLSNGIPYGVTLGNHDFGSGGGSGSTTFFNQYFGVNHFENYDYYGGHYGVNNNNNFQFFSASGLDFILINLEYNSSSAPAAVLAWADNVLKTYPNRRAIVTSHWIVNIGNPATFGAPGQAIYNALKNNTNLFMLLCGHVHGEGQRSDVFEGRTVHSVLSDYQGRSGGGDGWLRYYVFSPSNNVIRAHTYSPWLNQTETDTDSRFDLPYQMVSQAPWVAIATNSNVASGSSAVALWSNLTLNTEYEWYATVSDGVNATSGPVSRFTTETNVPPVAQDVTLARAPGLTLKVAIASLLANYTSDTNGDARMLLAVGNSVQGAAVNTNATHIFYSPTNNNADNFTYLIGDDHGHTASANINVIVVNPGGISREITASNGVVNIQFAGIPGYEYDVQRSTNLASWLVLTNLTAPPSGLFQLIETNAPSPSFYRLMQH